MIDLQWIRSLIDMVDDSGIDSLEISRLGTRVRIAKSPPLHVTAAGALGSAVAPAPAANPVTAPEAAVESADVPAAEPSELETAGEGLTDITSPMVGTFYRAPAPDAPPYVELGDRVERGQTLCILEAMKLMNELEAEVSGTIREICVTNAEPVEFGQALFRIEPA